jgi:helix-turn-helix protein
MQSDSRRVVLQKDLSSKDYDDLMMNELEDLHMIRLKALENIEKNKMRVAKYYNKKVKVKQFAEGDLVWKALFCRLELSIVRSANGPRIGKDPFVWLGAHLEMRIS